MLNLRQLDWKLKNIVKLLAYDILSPIEFEQNFLKNICACAHLTDFGLQLIIFRFPRSNFFVAIPGIIQGCYPSQNLDFDCEFVNSCRTDNITYASSNQNAIGSGRWATTGPCDGRDNQCIWEKQEAKVGDAFKMFEGVLIIDTAGFYMIDTALWNNDRGAFIGIRLKKNWTDISKG